jgi:hypothetical protein
MADARKPSWTPRAWLSTAVALYRDCYLEEEAQDARLFA